MGHGEYCNITVSMKKGMETYVRQVMDCLFPKKADCGSEDIILSGFEYCEWSQEGSNIDADELFQLMNTLFGSTYVYAEEGEYHTVSDYYKRDEEIYDPVRMERRYAGYEKCYGSADFDEASFWDVDKDELRERLKAGNLYDRLNTLAAENAKDDEYWAECFENADEPKDCIDWIGYLWDDFGSDLFYECDDLLDGLGEELMVAMGDLLVSDGDDSYEGSNPIKMEEVDQEIIDILIQAVVEKGNTELMAMILEKTKKA